MIAQVFRGYGKLWSLYQMTKVWKKYELNQWDDIRHISGLKKKYSTDIKMIFLERLFPPYLLDKLQTQNNLSSYVNSQIFTE